MPMVTQEKRKPGRPSWVAPSEVPMVTQEDINCRSPTILMATHKMAIQIKYEPLTWDLVNKDVDIYTGEIIQYNYLMQERKKIFRKNRISKELG